MSKLLVKDSTLVDAIKYDEHGHPLCIRKLKPEHDSRTGELKSWFVEITCSKFFCWNHQMIWWHWEYTAVKPTKKEDKQ